MVAIVAGNGLGLFNTSLNTLGGAGTFGQGGGLGQAGGAAFVNAATGNLILQFNDEQLSGLGQDLYQLRTYNTQGVISDDDADSWRWQGERKVVLTGTVNTAGSTVTRTTGDGHQTVHAWSGTAYTSPEGDGAQDSLVWSAGTSEWLWTDGSARTVERYLGATGRLSTITDSDGTAITYAYDANGRLSSVKDSSGQELVLNYNAAGKLEHLDTRTASGGALTRQVYYSYNASGRLISVSTDLTPNDNSITDGKVYTTTYSYDGTSFRIAGISQSDGTSVAYTYVLVDSEYRVASVTDTTGTSTFSYDTVNRRTDVSNGLGQQWSYFYDVASQLTQVLTPAVNGQRLATSYGYDASGNVTSLTDGRGNIITYQYDTSGNRTLERDALGNTVTRVYSSANLLLNESRYTVPATYDSATSTWTNPASSTAQTTRYVYDSSNRMRYRIGAAGTVSESRYNSSGQRIQDVTYGDLIYSFTGLTPTVTLSEATLNTWAAARDKTRSQLTELSYDYRGNLSKTTTYATVDSTGAGALDTAAQVTEYVYSEYGQLLQTIAVRGATRTSKTTLSSLTYDGQGRLLSQVDASGTQTYVYTGASRQIALTNTAGMTVTQSFDTRGRRVSLTQAATGLTSRVTQYIYDAAGRQTLVQDATGVRTYTLYDEAGRVSAKIDGTGAVTESVYNDFGQPVQEIRYATLADTTTWYSGGIVTKTLVSQIRPVTSSDDRATNYAYDNAGRLVTRTDAAGTVTTYSYDGRNQLTQTQTLDRTTRFFFDAAGRQTGQLDAEGYLRESLYNAAGQLLQVVRYNAISNSAYRVSGTLAQLRPSATGALSTWYFYDDAGRQVGSVDEQQFVTETVFDEALNTQQSIRYVTAYAASISVTTDFAVIRTAVDSTAKQTTTTAYDGYGRVSTQAVTDGTITAYEYDTAGRLVKQTTAQGSAEERSTRTRYDSFNQVIGQLGGEASTRITVDMTDTQVAAVFSQYGIKYGYDPLGRKATFTDAAGNRTIYYYDAEGRLTQTINGEGGVVERLYSALGDVRESSELNGKLTLANRQTMTGGVLTSTVKTLVDGIRNAAEDTRTVYGYDTRGLLSSVTDAEGFLTTTTYNGFGERSQIVRAAGTIEALSYSKRGLLTSRVEDQGGLNRTTATSYDAFGRVISRTDGLGKITTSSYGSNGRIITVADPLSHSRSSEYDAFGRVLKQTDAYGNATTYAYNDVSRTLMVTTPEGIVTRTTKSRQGETVSVTDGNSNTTQYTYNKDGLLLTTIDALGQVSTNTYDNPGRLIESIAADGSRIRYTYDGVNRVALRSSDATLGNTTRYEFDGQGHQLKVTEGEGSSAQRITMYGYDRKGQIEVVTVDPSGQSLTTTYAYDSDGKQLSVARGDTSSPAQQITTYVYDDLGRRLSETTDPSGLALTTQYRYDLEDRVTRKIDPAGNSTWYTYDAIGQLQSTVDAEGRVIRYFYDGNNRQISTLQYANVIAKTTLATYGDSIVIVAPTADVTRDQRDFAVYDRDGRQRYAIDAFGRATELRYDAAGNVIERIRHNSELPSDTLVWQNNLDTDLAGLNVASALTTYPDIFRYENSQLVVRSADGTATTPLIYGDSRAFQSGRTYRLEVTLGATLPTNVQIGVINEGSNVGAQSGWTYRRQSLLMSGGNWYSSNVDNLTNGSTLLTAAKVNTTYVLEIETRAGGTTLYIYEKGKTRADGFKNDFNTSGWDETRLVIYGYRGVGYSNGEVALDNISISERASTVIDGTRTRQVYDKLNRLHYSVDELGYVTEMIYDAGGQITERRRHGKAIAATVAGTEVAVKTALTGSVIQRTSYVYDSAGRLRFTVDALNSVTETRYDALGRVVDTIRHNVSLPAGTVLTEAVVAGVLYPVWQADLSSDPVAGLDTTSLTTYPDVMQLLNGELVLRNAVGEDAMPTVYGTTRTYAPGQVYQAEIRFGETLPQSFQIGLSNTAATGGTTYRSQLLSFAAGSFATQSLVGTTNTSKALGTAKINTTYVLEIETRAEGTVLYVYEKGKTRASGWTQWLETTGWSNVRWMVQGQRSPAFDNSEAYIDNLKLWTQNGTPPAGAQRTRVVYDALGRLRYSIDALNQVSERVYNDLNQVVQEKRYSAVIAVPATLTETTVKAALGSIASVSTYHVFDAVGRERFVIDGLDQATELSYDANGQVIKQERISVAITRPATLTETSVKDAITAAQTAAGNPVTPTTRYIYDQAGQLRYTLDALNYVSENRYDGRGQLIQSVRFAKAIAEPASLTPADVNAAAYAANPSGAGARSSWTVYDRLGRERYTINSLSQVTETVHDRYGNVVETRQYDKAIAATAVKTEAGIAAALTTAGAAAVTTAYSYDIGNRLTRTTDALGKLEDYTYDTFGNRKTLKNKNGAVWTYNYDALNRLTEEITPAVSVTSIAADTNVVTAATRYLVTTISYDALGNVSSRVEGRQRVAVANAATSDDLSQARTTSYGYDVLSRQKLITSPGWYNLTTGNFQQAGDGTSNTFQVTTEVSYDVLGNAVRNRVRVGNAGTAADYADSYKVYDAIGQLRYDIDALKGVVLYGYDGIGNQVTVRRHANALTLAAPTRGYYVTTDITTSNLVANASADRTLTTTYDALGRKTAVQQDQVSLYTFSGSAATSSVITAAPTTVYSYNGFNQVTRQTQVARDSSGATVQIGGSTTYYYDLGGNRVGTVDALGYYTRSDYNALGQLSRQVEFAKVLTSWSETTVPTAPAAQPTDRSTAYGYDVLGRMITVTQENVAYWTQAIDGSTKVVSATKVTGNRVVSTTTYDGVGNVLTQTDAMGNVTTMVYNARGQVTTIIEPARTAAKAGAVDPFADTVVPVVASPVIAYLVNAFGQVIRQTRTAGKDASNTAQAGLTQVTRTVYDTAGNEVRSIDASNVGIVDYKVDVAGRRIEEKQLVNAALSAWTLADSTKQSYNQTLRVTYSYDLLGRQASTSVWYTAPDATQKSTTTSAEYNHFGEVAVQRLNGFQQASYGYDKAGRVISQVNGQGTTQIDYNLAGQATRSNQIGDSTITTDDRLTYSQYDLLGRATAQYLPAFEANTSADTLNTTTLALTTPIIRHTTDRWGNVLTRTDARTQITTYSYDANNRVLTEILPQTDILRENGTSYRSSLIHEKRYDALGNLIQEVDLVGPYTGQATSTPLRTRQKVYNEVGQVIREVDALGNGSRFLYDSNGNRVASRNAIGTVLTETYDAMDRQLTHGIVRTKLVSGVEARVRDVLLINQYDQAGRLYGEISGTSAVEETLQSTANTTTWGTTSTGVVGNTKYTLWDERGNISRTRNESKVEKSSVYDQGNRKVEERDGLGNTLTWTYDDANYGSLVSRKDLSGRVYSYTYTAFGQVATESLQVNGSDSVPPIYEGYSPAPYPKKRYDYYSNGAVRNISEGYSYYSADPYGMIGDATYTSDYRTSYEYDSAGMKSREINSGLSEIIWADDPSSPYRIGTSVDVRYDYDEQGRISGVKSPKGSVLVDTYTASATAQIDAIKYSYDEYGNRRRVVLDVTDQGGKRTLKDGWYKYDLEGRVIISDGEINSDGVIYITTNPSTFVSKGYFFEYNEIGQRLASERVISKASYYGNDLEASYSSDMYGKEFYTYNDFGELTSIFEGRVFRASGTAGYGVVSGNWNYFSDAYRDNVEWGYYGAMSDPTVLKYKASYNVGGSRTSQNEYKYNVSYVSDNDGLYHMSPEISEESLSRYTYRGDGQLVSQLSYNVVDGVEKISQASFFNEYGLSATDLNGNGQLDDKVYMRDAAGSQASYRYVIYKTNGITINYRGNYTKSYSAYDTYKESKTVATWTKPGTAGETNFTYSERGELLGAVATGGVKFTRSFASNREGQLIARREASKEQSYIYYQGAPIANVGNISTPEITDTFEPISADYPANTPSSYVVNQGDTLRRIAQTVWGDSAMWYLIADANGLDPAVELTAGDSLKIPNVVSSTHNDATTFKPYDPTDVIGNTTPSPKPPPPPKKKCGGLAAAIIIVVSIVAAVFCPVLLNMGPGLASAMVGAAAGNVAGQVAGNIMGVQSGFDWSSLGKSVLTAGLTYGVMQGISAAGGPNIPAGLGKAIADGNSYGAVAAYSVAQNVVGQGVGMVVGTQKSFSWASVAASAAGGLFDAKFGTTAGIREAGRLSNQGAFGQGNMSWSQIGRATMLQLGRNIVTSSVQIAVNGQGKLELVDVVADAFGNALGNSLIGTLQDGSAEKRAQELKDALKEFDVVKDDAKAVRDALRDPNKIAVLRGKGLDPGKLRATYVADLVSGDVYLDPKSGDFGNAEKLARMEEALGYFDVHRLFDEQLTEMKLDPTKFLDKTSGYHAALYKDGVTGGYLLANRGTESFRDAVTDLVNNYGGVDMQFEQAVSLARVVSLNKEIGSNVMFTGHSLGGGLASAQAARVGGNAITFNAAGLTQRVADKLKLDFSDKSRARIEANYLQGDIVSGAQDSFLIDGLAAALGTPLKYGIAAAGLLSGQIKPMDLNVTIGYAPEAFGVRNMIQPADDIGWSPITRHFNSSVLHSLTAEYLSATSVTREN